MKLLLKIAIGSSAVLAGVVANAAQLPLPGAGSTPGNPGNSNLLFYVADLTTNSTYTVDLTTESVQGGTVSVNGVPTATNSVFTHANSLSSTTQGVVNTINGDTGFSFNFTTDTGLTSFINTAVGANNNIVWGIYGEGDVSATKVAQGNALVVTTGDPAVVTALPVGGVTGTSAVKLATDYSTINTGFASSSDLFPGAPGTPAGVFGTGTNTALSFYGQNMTVGQTVGAPATELYGITGNGTSATGYALAFGLGTIQFAGDILTFTGNSASTVPVPGAVWLLGSGLLGLLGIGRRRERTTGAGLMAKFA
jgi:hypothetical protein